MPAEDAVRLAAGEDDVALYVDDGDGLSFGDLDSFPDQELIDDEGVRPDTHVPGWMEHRDGSVLRGSGPGIATGMGADVVGGPGADTDPATVEAGAWTAEVRSTTEHHSNGTRRANVLEATGEDGRSVVAASRPGALDPADVEADDLVLGSLKMSPTEESSALNVTEDELETLLDGVDRVHAAAVGPDARDIVSSRDVELERLDEGEERRLGGDERSPAAAVDAAVLAGAAGDERDRASVQDRVAETHDLLDGDPSTDDLAAAVAPDDVEGGRAVVERTAPLRDGLSPAGAEAAADLSPAAVRDAADVAAAFENEGLDADALDADELVEAVGAVHDATDSVGSTDLAAATRQAVSPEEALDDLDPEAAGLAGGVAALPGVDARDAVESVETLVEAGDVSPEDLSAAVRAKTDGEPGYDLSGVAETIVDSSSGASVVEGYDSQTAFEDGAVVVAGEFGVQDDSLPDVAEGVVDDLTPEPNDLRRVAMDVATDDETVDVDRGHEPSA